MDFFEETCKKVEKKKREHHHRILHIRNILGTKFQLKVTILSIWTRLTRKGYFKSKKKKIKIALLELVSVLHFSFNKQFSFFWKNFPKKGFFRSKMEKGIFHNRISLSTKFQLKLTILIFWTKFALNGYLLSQPKKSLSNSADWN